MSKNRRGGGPDGRGLRGGGGLRGCSEGADACVAVDG